MASAASLHDPASRLIAASDAAKPAARASADGEKSAQKGTKSHMSFWDFVDIINPLQHIPVVGTIYREITHDTIKAPAKIAGSALYGGPVGLALAIGDQIVEAKSGKSVEGHVMALLHGDQPAPSDTMLAANEPAAELTDDEIEAMTVDRAPTAPSPVQVALLDAPPATPAAMAAAVPAARPQMEAAQPVRAALAPTSPAAATPAGSADPRLVAARAQIIAAQAATPPATLAAPANSPLVLDQNTDALLMAMFGGGAKPAPAANAPAGGSAAPAAAGGAIPIAAAAAPIAVSPKPTQVATATPAATPLSDAVRPANAPRGLGLDSYRMRAGAAPVRDPMPNRFAQINQREANRAPPAAIGIARPAAPEPKDATAAPAAPANGETAKPLDLPAPLPREQIPAAMIAAMEKYQAQARSRAAGSVDQHM